MAASAESCSHCGKAGVGLKRCSRCKQASYCGAACQNAGWKGHKKTCAPPVPLQDLAANLLVAHTTGDWRGVLKWEGRMEELMARQPDAHCASTLAMFSLAHRAGLSATGSKDHARSFVGLEERRSPLLANLQRFRGQGEAMCEIASMLVVVDQLVKAVTWFQRARDVGAAHGFFLVESAACKGLGRVSMQEGRHEEGVALLQNALAAAQLNEMDDPKYEIGPLAALVDALFTTDAIDEAEPLVLRFRETAKTQSEKDGFCFDELRSVLSTARLHEARGRPDEAAREVRALLDLIRENEAAVQNMAAGCAAVLQLASQRLTVLDPGVGDKELIQAVAVKLAQLCS